MAPVAVRRLSDALALGSGTSLSEPGMRPQLPGDWGCGRVNRDRSGKLPQTQKDEFWITAKFFRPCSFRQTEVHEIQTPRSSLNHLR